MSACAMGELLAQHITGAQLPEYASALELSRYEHTEYLKSLENMGENGEL